MDKEGKMVSHPDGYFSVYSVFVFSIEIEIAALCILIHVRDRVRRPSCLCKSVFDRSHFKDFYRISFSITFLCQQSFK